MYEPLFVIIKVVVVSCCSEYNITASPKARLYFFIVALVRVTSTE
jgi:hypothetical protein